MAPFGQTKTLLCTFPPSGCLSIVLPLLSIVLSLRFHRLQLPSRACTPPSKRVLATSFRHATSISLRDSTPPSKRVLATSLRHATSISLLPTASSRPPSGVPLQLSFLERESGNDFYLRLAGAEFDDDGKEGIQGYIIAIIVCGAMLLLGGGIFVLWKYRARIEGEVSFFLSFFFNENYYPYNPKANQAKKEKEVWKQKNSDETLEKFVFGDGCNDTKIWQIYQVLHLAEDGGAKMA